MRMRHRKDVRKDPVRLRRTKPRVAKSSVADPDKHLLDQLLYLIGIHVGERGGSEGAIETLARIISERDAAQASAAESDLRALEHAKKLLELRSAELKMMHAFGAARVLDKITSDSNLWSLL